MMNMFLYVYPLALSRPLLVFASSSFEDLKELSGGGLAADAPASKL